MTAKWIKVLIGFFWKAVFLTALTGQSVDSISLPACLRLAEEKYPLLVSQPLYQEQLQQTLENIRRAYTPELNLNAQAAYYSDVVSIDIPAAIPGLTFPQPAHDQYAVSLDVRQLIYDGGMTRNREVLETENTRIKQQDLVVRTYRFKTRVAKLFFSATTLDENFSMLKQSESQLEQTIREAQAALDNGVLLQSDVNILLAARLDIQQQMKANRHDRTAVIKMLGAYLDTTFTAGTILSIPEPVSQVSGINRPENQLFSLQRSMLDASINLVQASHRPKLYGFGQVGYGRPGLNPMNEDFNGYYLFGARLSWNLWDGNQTGRKKKILSIQKENVGTEEATFMQEVKTELIRAREEVEKMDTLIAMDRERVALRKQITEEYSSKLALGTITPAEYERQFSAYRQACIQLSLHKQQKLEKQFDYMITNGNLQDYENRYH